MAENKQGLPLWLISDKKEKHVLYMQDPCNDGVGYFAWIKNPSHLVRSTNHRLVGKRTRNFSAIVV